MNESTGLIIASYVTQVRKEHALRLNRNLNEFRIDYHGWSYRVTVKGGIVMAYKGLVLCAALLSLSACGGDSSPPAPPPPPLPTVNVVIYDRSTLTPISEVGEPTIDIAFAMTTDTGVYPANAYADVLYDHGIFSSASISGSGPYTVTLTTSAKLAAGTYTGNAIGRLCETSTCARVYPGSQQNYAYSITITPHDWSTYQANPAHTGYIDLTLNPALFTNAWQYSEPTANVSHLVNMPVVGNNSVYVTTYTTTVYDPDSRKQVVSNLDEATGAPIWQKSTYVLSRSFSSYGEGMPTYYRGYTFVPHLEILSGGISSVFGKINQYNSKNSTFNGWFNLSYVPSPLTTPPVVHTFPPVLRNNKLYVMNAGWRDSPTPPVISSYTALFAPQSNTENPIPAGWSVTATGSDVLGGEALGLDDKYVYYYSGSALIAYNIADGAQAFTIADPQGAAAQTHGYDAAPIVGDSNDVITYSGLPGRTDTQRNLVSFDILNKVKRWKSANAYQTAPALAKGVIYVARNSPLALDALSETDGHVLWSWTPPAGTTAFFGNTVASNNLVFVSTNNAVYALDINTHNRVWSYASAGTMALSAKGTLLIATGYPVSDGKIVAVRLK